MTEQDLRDFARQPGVDKDAIRRLLDEGPRDRLPEYMLDLDQVASEEVSTYPGNVYVMWEYRGPLDRDEMELLMAEIARAVAGDGDEGVPLTVEIDPLMQLDAVLFFCQGEACKWGVNHMEDNAPISSAFQIERSPARLWGVGIPYLLREQQAIIHDAWRGMMDNAAFAARPQAEINTAIVQRPDGAPPIIEPGGVWERAADAGDQRGLFFHDVPIHQEHYAAIIEMALRFVDTETNISILASGEQGARTTRTAGGIGLLMNAVNVVFRRVVKNYDDGMTATSITRAYHYLMVEPQTDALVDECRGAYAVGHRCEVYL